jgi:pimeloyl-ACP methyl ester carboxylesterase
MQSNPPKKRWLRRLRIALVVFGGYAFLCVYLAHVYVHPRRPGPLLRPYSIKEISIPSGKGPVPTWVTPRLATGAGKPVVFVMAYGLGGDRENWSDQMLSLSKLGYECVAPSMPGQDASPDDGVGFGVKEATMVLDTVKWVRLQYKKPPKIILWGLSMGGAAVWLASEQDPTVDAVVTEGAYSQFDEAMNNWLNRKLPGSSFYLKPMIWLASYQANVDPAKIIPRNSAAKWRKPALVVQGAEDQLIPMHQAEDLSKAARCPLWVVPNATHAQCWPTARKEFLKKLTDLAKQL